jgi:hypothetical protein
MNINESPQLETIRPEHGIVTLFGYKDHKAKRSRWHTAVESPKF